MIIPVTSSGGVTSKAGFIASIMGQRLLPDSLLVYFVHPLMMPVLFFHSGSQSEMREMPYLIRNRDRRKLTIANVSSTSVFAPRFSSSSPSHWSQ